MARWSFAILFLVISSTTYGQGMPGSYLNYNYRGANSLPRDSTPKKWSFNKYSSLSTSFMFSRAGSATIVSAPMGVQLNRRLTNNLYAFAGGFIAPSYISFRGGNNFSGDKYQLNPGLRTNSLGVYSRAELGLMYVNDEKTFSISGSVGIERRDFGFPGLQQQSTFSKETLRP